MSLGRRRNVYTLGNFQTKLHDTDATVTSRINTDPFERDPFKIHSYNFHYAERPIYPLEQITQRPTPNPIVTKPFNTVFYNYDFATHRPDKENNSTDSFHEYRRRKFLHDYQTTSANMYGGSGTTDSSYCDHTGSEQQTWLWQQHTQTPQTMHQLQFQPPYQQYQQLQLQQEYSESVPHKQNQQHCDRKAISAFGGTRISSPAATTAIKADSQERAGPSTAYGRTQMPHYPSAANTLTSIYQRDTAQRDRLSRLYGLSKGNESGEQEANTTSGANSGTALITGSGGSGGFDAKATTSRTSLGSLRSRSPTGRRGLRTENGSSCSIGHHAGILTDKTNRDATISSTIDSHRKCEWEGRATKQQSMRVAFGSSNGAPTPATTGVAGCLSAPSRPRRPLQVVHAPTQTVVSGASMPTASSASLVSKRSTCSGCRININIHGGEDTRMLPRSRPSSDGNVTIKIQTEACKNPSFADIASNELRNTNRYHTNGSSALRRRQSSPSMQNNLSPTRSTETLIIDKHISKFSIVSEKEPAPRNKRPRSHSLTRTSDRSVCVSVRENRGPWAQEMQQAAADLKAELAKQRRSRELEERVPSLLPWRLDTTIRDYYSGVKKELPREKNCGFGSTSSFERVRNSYDACLQNLHNLKKFNNEQFAALTNSKSPQRSAITRAEHKLLNTIGVIGSGIKRSTSRHSILSNLESKRLPMKPSPLDSDMHLLLRASPSSTTALKSVSSHNLNQAPLKVNINVYTDKLKLLRV